MMGFEGLGEERALDFFRVFLKSKLVHEDLFCGKGTKKWFFTGQIYVFGFQVPAMTHF